MGIAYLSLGTNIGRKEDNLRKALRALEQEIGTLLKCSSFIDTAPWGFDSTHRFLNAAVSFQTELQPLELLKVTQQIERKLGRNSKSHNGLYQDRIIDIDILFYDQQIIQTEELTLPHPLISQRRFVLEPLSEIAAHFVHPTLHASINELLHRLTETNHEHPL